MASESELTESAHFTTRMRLAGPAGSLHVGRDEFIQRGRDAAFVTAAYVMLDGSWRDQDTSGFPPATYTREVTIYIDGLADETILAIVRCHA